MCLSFATISFLNVWADLLERKADFYRSYIVTWQELAAVSLGVLLFGFLLWIPVVLVLRSGNRTAIRTLKWCAFFAMTLPLNCVRKLNTEASGAWLPTLVGPSKRMLPGLLILAAAFLLWKWERRASKVVATILITFAPLLPLVVAKAAWDIYNGPPAGRFPNKPAVEALQQKPGAPHVLWIIFDEWDQALTFRNRPADLSLPELDRFRSQSFHADLAYPPTRATIRSIPSLLSGKTFIDAVPNGANELLLNYIPDRPPERFSAQSTVFSEARREGFNVGIVGFYLPYCRIFDATFCEWQPGLGFFREEWAVPLPFRRFIVLVAKRQIQMIPFARRIGFLRAVSEEDRIFPLDAIAFRRTREAALHSIVDPRLNLVFIHLNIPHPPAIDDLGATGSWNSHTKTYLDNLRLLDLTVRDIRLTLAKAGIWDNSTILMSSDHPLRLQLWPTEWMSPPSAGNLTQTSEVPFLLKMAGQKEGYAYKAAIQTVVSKDLLHAIMKGEISKPEQVAAWLDHNPPVR